MRDNENCKHCEKIDQLQHNVIELQQKIDHIANLLENNIAKNCNKMGDHIDFVENIYDNVKNPLGYLCYKVNSLIYNKKDYSLDSSENRKKLNFENHLDDNT